MSRNIVDCNSVFLGWFGFWDFRFGWFACPIYHYSHSKLTILALQKDKKQFNTEGLHGDYTLFEND